MAELDPSSSGTSLLPPPTNNEIWFQDAIPLQEETSGAATGKWEVPSAPWWHKLTMALAVIFPFLGTIYGIAWMWERGFMGWFYLSMLIGGWFMTGLGVTIGFHRLLSHRSFDTYGWVRTFWMACGSLSVEGSPLTWCATHRRHHEMSDKPGDPHTPHLHGEGLWNMLKGFWYAHTGWLFTGYWNDVSRDRYIPDLITDPALVMVDKLYYLWVLASLTLPAIFAGIVMQTWEGVALGFLWGGLVRIFMTHHVTWSINSICHIFGSREFKAYDESRNNWIFGLLAFGEGWHNNHHAFPTSARHGLRWWQFDSSWLIISTMKMLGLVWNVRLPSEKQMAKRKVKAA
jgi:stearoyl-CoA desaturase (Delta-9 desaturase)